MPYGGKTPVSIMEGPLRNAGRPRAAARASILRRSRACRAGFHLRLLQVRSAFNAWSRVITPQRGRVIIAEDSNDLVVKIVDLSGYQR